MTLQTTLARESGITGKGLHSGKIATLRLLPANVDSGIEFRVFDGDFAVCMPARHDHLSGSAFRTSLCRDGRHIDTVEHILAALYAHGIDNAIIEIAGSEVPAVDGSALPWSMMLLDAGVEFLDSPRKHIKILKHVKVIDQNGSWCSISPCDRFRITYDLEYQHPMIGHQSFSTDVSPLSFIRDTAGARTFGFAKDISFLESMGLAKGVGLDNTLAFDDHGVMNPEGMRWPDEPARHKVLDVVGDLALIGYPLIGEFHGYRSGHRLNQQLVSAIVADTTAWTVID